MIKKKECYLFHQAIVHEQHKCLCQHADEKECYAAVTAWELWLLEQKSSWLGEVRVWGGPVEVTGAEVSGERWGRGQRCGGRLGRKEHQSGMRMICGEADLRLCLSLHECRCKAALGGRVDVSQAGLRVFGFLNAPSSFEVGALGRVRAGHWQ